MKLLTVIGARPQFIKAATVSRAIAQHNTSGDAIDEILVHTGQHYDASLSQVFFDELSIPHPQHHLGIGDLPHGAMTGRMLEAVETIMLGERPDWALVYGDTNSTLAGALAAAKLNIPCAHVEAGLRSFNRRMPEEINRIVVDAVSALLLCPNAASAAQLKKEDARGEVRVVGDVMFDAAMFYRDTARTRHRLERWGLESGAYVLCTVHRAENTDDPERLSSIWAALLRIAQETTVVFPAHPRTRKLLPGAPHTPRMRVIDPVSYIEMVRLEMDAQAILTDSGGVQKEAFFHGVPCLTLRGETEWPETVASGWNRLCGTSGPQIVDAWRTLQIPANRPAVDLYGDGHASEYIVREILNYR